MLLCPSSFWERNRAGRLCLINAVTDMWKSDQILLVR
jgi:hypothetical protein